MIDVYKCAQKLSELEEENQRLKEENARLKTEMSASQQLPTIQQLINLREFCTNADCEKCDYNVDGRCGFEIGAMGWTFRSDGGVE